MLMRLLAEGGLPNQSHTGELLALAEKVAASSWGRAGRARSGLGRGGVGMRPGRVTPVSSTILCAGRRNGRAVVAERDPDILVALRLPFDEAVAGLGPGQDVFVLVVENELALVGLHR